MGRLENMKSEYDNIPIPKELNARIQKEIEKSEQRLAQEKKVLRLRRRSGLRKAAAAAAAVCVVFTAALNTSTAFAEEAAQLPVIGTLARVLTFRTYESEKDGIGISVEVPTLDMIQTDTGIKVDEVNQEIYNLCRQYADEAVSRAEEYRKAFLDTGGTEEEWKAHNIQIQVGYEIKSQTDQYLSFIVRGTESWTTAYSEERYYNIDVNTGKMVTLEDLLGSDYIRIADESIGQQISSRQEAGEVFWSAEEGGFTGISENAKFYINENGNPVIVFEKYEIAPGSSGEIEFEIGG
ncbi:DUF3298 domain-containing protein [Clostridium sp. AM29-11AC]|uniref:RsiV family protein n=1 Tax=Clostridium sp. AM29-11AC TaxID=2293028 RepID=UPI000E476CA1|nr:RsiV family protein [Clostridium sp. AM29-11AC]RHT59654.1 DUF3298 domain-containing protein [Clostridium sp. AM29-11AC]